VRLFGLHLVPLDVREDARLHRAALDEISALTGCATATRMLRKRSARRCWRVRSPNRARAVPAGAGVFRYDDMVIATWRMIAVAPAIMGRV